MIKKLIQQYVSPFQILEKAGRLAYKLDFSGNWKIHPVFSVAQLKSSSPLALDLFSKPFFSLPPPVFVEGNIDTLKSFEIEKFLNKRLVKQGKGQNIKYLVWWKGYDPKWDQWYNIKEFDDIADLVDNYEASLLASIGTHFFNMDINFSFW